MTIKLSLLSLLLVGLAAGQSSEPKRLDSAARAALRDKMIDARQTQSRAYSGVSSQGLGLTPPPADSGAVDITPQVLVFGNFWTFVPAGAVIHVPERLQNRVNGQPSGTLLEFRDFLNRNRGWIITREVSRSQAAGKTPFSEKFQQILQNSGQVNIATLSGNPVSINPSVPTTNQ